MRISIVVACSDNRVIGRDGQLPWRLSGDLRHFRRLTMGHTLLMGRKTFQSIGRPLPGRTTIVLTRRRDYRPESVLVAHSWNAALREAARCAGEGELFVVGGAEVYALALPYAQRIYLTQVHAQVEGDAHLTELDTCDWRVVAREECAADPRNEYPYSLIVLDRVGPPPREWRAREAG